MVVCLESVQSKIKRGCGVWVLAAVWGTLYQLVITPIRWADDTAGRMAKDVEWRMEQEAEAGFMCQIPMRRLRETGEDAWPLYQGDCKMIFLRKNKI